jgi:UDP-N-acetyl-D-galactosamine dehydrogenase
LNDKTIAVIGLGYVGLPLAVAFGKKFPTVGFDLNQNKIDSYQKGIDPTGEVIPESFAEAKYLTATSNPAEIGKADFIIVAVPTPIDEAHKPDLTPLVKGSEIVGQHMQKGVVVIFESTVYPGATEEVCVPIMEKASGLTWKQDFHVGYSPERINPGDHEHTLSKITKVVSGDTPETLEKVADLYSEVVMAGVFKAKSLKEAEAAKVIENIQRDLNIALINELSIIFDRLDIDTTNVLEAAGTKWNFLPFRPGLVGGHCIGVDPYYLTHKAELVGYRPEVILAGRRINDQMGKFIAEKTVKIMIQVGRHIKGSRVGVCGLTFKEDCPDLRNSRTPDIVAELEAYGIRTLVHDPLAEPSEALAIYNIQLSSMDEFSGLDAMVFSVAHGQYRTLTPRECMQMLVPGGCIIDVKSIFKPEDFENTGFSYWRL